jgi:lipopolysaccharide export system protein LptC
VSQHQRSGNTRGLAVLVPLTILLLLVMLTTWLNRTIELSQPAPPRAITHDPDYKANNFTVIRLSDTGEMRYSLTAKELVHYPDDDTTHLVQPQVKQLQPGKPDTRARADRGLSTAQGEEIRLYDNVEIFRAGDKKPGAKDSEAQDLRITSSYMRLHPDEDTADTPAQVVIENGASTLIGTGGDFDNRYRKMKLHSAVTAKYIQPNNKK